MSQFTVVNNEAILSPLPSVAPRRVESGDARQLLVGRQFHVCGTDVDGTAEYIQAGLGGAFLANARLENVRTYKQRNPSVPFIYEPQSILKRASTADHLFFDANGVPLAQSDLAHVLDEQRAWGSDLAMLPTGQIQGLELPVLEETIKRANLLDRTDLIVPVALSGAWLSDPTRWLSLVPDLNQSRHPVALAFYDSKGRAVESAKRIHAHEQLISLLNVPVVAYRIGMTGFSSIAFGATASAIGSYPTVRGLTTHNAKKGGPPGLVAPSLLFADMLQFVSSVELRIYWFNQAAKAFTCNCSICLGLPVDRLHETSGDRMIGHQHNTLEIDRLFASLVNVAPADRLGRWSEIANRAADTYLQLKDYTKGSIIAPLNVRYWTDQLKK